MIWGLMDPEITNRITVEVEPRIKAALKFYCDMNNQTESEVVAELLKELLERARLFDGQA